MMTRCYSYIVLSPVLTVEFLLQDGTTPLILASANGHLECVQELLEQGANPTAKRVVSAEMFSYKCKTTIPTECYF